MGAKRMSQKFFETNLLASNKKFYETLQVFLQLQTWKEDYEFLSFFSANYKMVSEVYSEPYETTKIERFARIVNI